jgi:signal transduction histidine kinase
MKPDVVFGLDNAEWPVLMVDPNGVIRNHSRGAAAVFGKIIEGSSVLLSSLWAMENDSSAVQFLSLLDISCRSYHQILFNVLGGRTESFATNVCQITVDGKKLFILQMFTSASGNATNPAEAKVQLAESAAQKQKLDCALQLTRTVALDFNNALTSILGHTSLLLGRMESDHPWRPSLLEVEKSAGKAAEIAADLAAFSRQERDARSQQAGNLNSVLTKTVELFQKSPGNKHRWTVNLEKRLYTVTFDEAKIQQAAMKVLENAVQAIPDDQTGHVHIQSRNLDLTGPTQDRNAQLAVGSYVCLEIADDGAGIAAENLNRIFEPFFTTKHGHRGLGLAWVYGIVTNHGGSVAVSSDSGHGTSVRIYLPAVRKVVREVLAQGSDLTGTQTILMVDDEDLMLTMGQTVLAAFGYQVLTANSGLKAVEILQNQRIKIDLVITDLVMPQMSGRDLIERIRQIRPGARIIYSSGYVRPNSEEEENYLQKPFTSQELLLKVKEILTAI